MTPLRHKLLRYEASIAAIKTTGRPVSKRKLADHSGDSYHDVRRFCVRHPSLATQLGLVHYVHVKARMTQCANELKAAGKTVTRHTLAERMGVKYHSVRTYLSRNPAVAKQLEIEDCQSTALKEYVEAIAEYMSSGKKWSVRGLACQMDRNHAAVGRYLLAHPEVNEMAQKVVSGMTVEEAILRWPRELTVKFYDDRAVRIVMTKVTHREYVRLWRECRLDFQMTGKPKPQHLPSPDELMAA